MSKKPLAVLTGAAGFIGSHLAEALLDRGWDVRGVDALTDHNGRERKTESWAALGMRSGFTGVEVDLRDADLNPIVEGAAAVLHLAALPGVRSSWGDAFREYSTTNIEATARLLEVCRGRGVPRFVYASSSSVYGNAQRFPVRETDPTNPISPYGVSKLAGEHLVRLYGTAYGLHTASLRFFTVYGPRQRPDMAFHRFIRGVLSGEPCTIFGDGEQTRDFTFVDDVVAACLGALEHGAPGAVYNIGGGSRVTLKEVIAIIERHAGRKGEWIFGATEKGDPRHTGADTSLARAEIEYAPKVPLEEGLRREVEWMSGQLSREAT